MSWIATAIIGGGALMGAGNYMSAKEGQGDYNIDKYGQLNPEQIALSKSLGPQLQSLSGASPQLYQGAYTGGLTQGEQDAIAQSSRLNALGEQGLQSALKGEFPEDYFQNSVYKPMLKQFNEDTLPGIQEAYANPSGSGYWGSARAGAVGKSYRDLTDTLASKRAELGWQAQQNIPNAISAANSLSTTNMAIQNMARLGLKPQYDEWVRGQESKQKYIDQAINFMNIGSVTSTYEPGDPSLAGSMMSGIGGGIMSAGMGGMLGGVSGGTGGVPAGQTSYGGGSYGGQVPGTTYYNPSYY